MIARINKAQDIDEAGHFIDFKYFNDKFFEMTNLRRYDPVALIKPIFSVLSSDDHDPEMEPNISFESDDSNR